MKEDYNIDVRFKDALELRDNPRQFIEAVCRLLGNHGMNLKTWADDMNDRVLEEKLADILNGGCSDQWEFLWKVGCGTGRSDSKETDDLAWTPGDDVDPDYCFPGHRSDDKTLSEEETEVAIIGERARQTVEEISELLSATVLAGRQRVVILQGPSCSGKSTVLREVRALLEEQQITCEHYRDARAPSRGRKRDVNTRDRVLFLDDADMDPLTNQQAENLFLNWYRADSSSICISCRDGKHLSHIAVMTGARKINMPLPTNDEAVEILSGIVTRGYHLDSDTARDLVQMAHGRGISNILEAGIETINYLLYPVLLKDMRENRDVFMQSLTVDRQTVATALRKATGISVVVPGKGAEEQMVDRLNRRIKGQDHVLRQIAPALVTTEAGLTDPSRPAGVFLFCGPSGTGKSELAKVIASEIANGNYHKEDMSTYSEKHSVARIVGSPAGYIGHDEVSPLLQFIHRSSSGVLIFDEIEKANSVVHDHIMEMLDTGLICDSRGIEYSARNMIIILTSNVQLDISQEIRIGFDNSTEVCTKEETTREKLLSTGEFKREFISRIQEICQFKSLEDDDLNAIASYMIADMCSRLASIGIVIPDEQQNSFVSEVIQQHNENTGARPMKSFVESVVKNRLITESLYKKEDTDENCTG